MARNHDTYDPSRGQYLIEDSYVEGAGPDIFCLLGNATIRNTTVINRSGGNCIYYAGWVRYDSLCVSFALLCPCQFSAPIRRPDSYLQIDFQFGKYSTGTGNGTGTRPVLVLFLPNRKSICQYESGFLIMSVTIIIVVAG